MVWIRSFLLLGNPPIQGGPRAQWPLYLEMKCLKNLVRALRMDRVRNEEVCRRAGIDRELVTIAVQRVLRWFGQMDRMDVDRMAKSLVP